MYILIFLYRDNNFLKRILIDKIIRVKLLNIDINLNDFLRLIIEQ